MDKCCLKLTDGTTCSNNAIKRIEFTARGLTFMVPVCYSHDTLLRNQKKPETTHSVLEDFLKNVSTR